VASIEAWDFVRLCALEERLMGGTDAAEEVFLEVKFADTWSLSFEHF
jgi:hypothetical protein